MFCVLTLYLAEKLSALTLFARTKIKKYIKKSKNIRVGSPDWGNIGSVDFKKLYKEKSQF